MVYCQNCGKDTAGAGVTFYGNVLCGEACKKSLSERLYFRDTPPEPGSTWFCPHCGGENPMGDPRKQLRPNCAQCGKPLDPASAAPPKKGGCLGALLLLALPVGLACAAALAACASDPAPASKPSARRAARPAPAGSIASSTVAAPLPAGSDESVPAARRARQEKRQQQQSPARPAARPASGASDAGAPDRGGDLRAEHRRRQLQRGAAGDSRWVGPVVAVGPVDAHARPDGFLHGAKFEPPFGRVLHGMGQWEEGNAAYVAALDDPALAPASRLMFLPIGDWPRPWSGQIVKVRRELAETAAAGGIPHIDISLYGLDEQNAQEGVDGAIAISDRYDGRVRDLARVVRSIDGPVFVRIGGEFNGDWSPYSPFEYPVAFRRIVELFRGEGVANAAFIWCYEPDAPDDFAEIDPLRGPRWYPGDDVVDWFGLDVFNADDFAGPFERDGAVLAAARCNAFLRMALEHDKPVIVAEASAAYIQLTPELSDGEADWDAWFGPFFQFLEANPNIQAFHYINVDWTAAGDYGAMGWKDARIDINPLITERFRAELRKPRYLHAGNTALLNGVPDLPPAVPAPPPEPAPAGESAIRGR